MISVMKWKLQEMTAENLSLAIAQTMKPKIVETFFNMVEKVATKNKFVKHLKIFSTLIKMIYI